MYRLQSKLPRLPVPALASTVATAVQYARVQAAGQASPPVVAAADTFLSGAGPKLQTMLEQFAADAPTGNWLEPIWDDSYLDYRGRLPRDMNYCLEADLSPAEGRLRSWSTAQVAAEACWASLAHHQRIERGELDVDMAGKDPTCMAQHARVFGHARIPRQGRDEAVCYARPPQDLAAAEAGGLHYATRYEDPPAPLTVTVLSRGSVFVLPLTEVDGATPSAALPARLAAIARDAPAEAGPGLAALTALPRDEWASLRDSARGTALGALFESVDRSLFVLCLDDEAGGEEEDGATVARFLDGVGPGGDVQCRWFDKHCLIVAPRAGGAPPRVAMLFEHMPGDGLTTMRWIEAVQSRLVDHDGPAPEAGPPPATGWLSHFPSCGGALPVPAPVLSAVASARDFLARQSRDGPSHGLHARGRGAAHWRSLGLPPDAGFQIALQAAHHALAGRLCGTYESCSTGRFLHGRTEVIRAASPATLAAIEALAGSDAGAVSRGDAAELITGAAASLRAHAKLCQQGLGIDRHLLGLRLMAERRAGDLAPEERAAAAAFLGDPHLAASGTWHLSTSNCGSERTAFFGFGPVVEDGVGVAYSVRRDDTRAFFCGASGEFSAPDLAAAFERACDGIGRVMASGRAAP